MEALVPLFIVLVIVFRVAQSSIIVVKAGETRVVERMGKVDRVLGPGVHLLVPLIERAVVPAAAGSAGETSAEQKIELNGGQAKTRDGVPVRIGASLAYRVADPLKAHKQTADLKRAMAGILESRLGKALGQVDARHVYESRERMAGEVQAALSAAAKHFGAEILRFGVDRLELATRDLGAALPEPSRSQPERARVTPTMAMAGESVRLAGDHEIDVAGIRAETGGGEHHAFDVHVRFTYRSSVRTAEKAQEATEELARIVRETVVEEIAAMETLPAGADLRRLGDLVLRALRSEAREAGAAVDRLDMARAEGRA
ncbi:MAG: SPFH domain-containing protein [Candidatus Binatia bacterium]